MTDPQTIRDYLERIRDRDRPAGGHPVWTRSEHGQVTHYGPGMDDYNDAVAALELIEKSRHAYRCRPGCWDCDIRDEPYRSNDVRIALLDDPAPRGDADA